jgi:hypothetical protein
MHWTAGPVVSNLDDLSQALDQAVAGPSRHLTTQQRLFSYSFDLGEEPSSHRAAEAIVNWLVNRDTAR